MTKYPVATIGWLKQSIHRSHSEVFSEIRNVPRELAEIILSSQNLENRRMREAKITQLVTDINNGHFVLNGEAIVFAKTGELNDGQHRLEAIRQAKRTIPLMFTFGVERATRTTLDQGISRTVGDYLMMDGKAYANTLASIARAMLGYERNQGKLLGRMNDIPPGDVLRRARDDRTILTSAQYASNRQKYMRGVCPPSVIGIAHNIIMNDDASGGITFMDMLTLGENIQRGDPAYTARARLSLISKASLATRVEIILRAWVAYKEKRQMANIPIHGRFPELPKTAKKMLEELYA